MKTFKIWILMMMCCGLAIQSFSQDINWGNLSPEQKHIVNANVGWDYGVVYGLGYSYQLKSKMPVLLKATYSFPSGSNLFDDFKSKIGGQIRLYQLKNFQLSISVNGIYRRYENPLARIQNLGGECSGAVGYYRTKWFIALESGFDKAVRTHLKHSDIYRETIYSAVQDGWYASSTGGNFNYGLSGGFSFGNCDLTAKFGKVLTQDFKTSPLIPFYTGVGLNVKIK